MNQLVTALSKVNQTTHEQIRTEVLAQVEAEGGDLSVLNDPGSFSTLLKLYQRFINDADLRGLPNFLVEVDQLLQEFGGQPKPPEATEEEGEGEGGEQPPAKPAAPETISFPGRA